MCCCCTRLHRHQIHLISYGCVSFGLITTGLVFTIFAIFQKESQIGKVWLAGPTTMVVGLVLCGKVIIDWGPAMLHAREGSVDSRLMDQMNHPISRMNDMPMRGGGQVHYEHEPKCNGGSQPPPGGHMGGHHGGHLGGPMGPGVGPPASLGLNNHGPPTARTPSYVRPGDTSSYQDAHSCLIYSQYDSSLTNLNGFQSVNRASPRNSSRPSSSNVNSPALSAGEVKMCDCSQYGTMRRQLPPFQGESFVLNERNYLI